MRKRIARLSAYILSLAMVSQSIFAYDVGSLLPNKVDQSEVDQEVDKNVLDFDRVIQAERTTGSSLDITYQVPTTTPSSIKLNAIYNATVRGGSHADKVASTSAGAPINKEILHSKWTLYGPDYNRRAYIQFEVSEDMNWEEIGKITLGLYFKERSGTEPVENIAFYTVENNVNEENMTWNNTPVPKIEDKIGEMAIKANETVGWKEIDVTEALKSYLMEQVGTTMVTICMSSITQSELAGSLFYSKYAEDGKYTPYLQIDMGEYQDTISPTIQVSGLTDGMYVTEPEVTFNVEAVDNYDDHPSIHITVNGVAQEGASSRNQRVTLTKSKNIIEIKAVDSSGNASEIVKYIVNYEGIKKAVTLQDTYIEDKANVNTVLGRREELTLKKTITGNERRTYLSFDLEGYQKRYIKDAKIQLTFKEFAGNDRSPMLVGIYEVAGFDESTLTWNTAPQKQMKVAQVQVPRLNNYVDGKSIIELNITEYINGKFKEGEALGKLNFILIDEMPSDQSGLRFYSKEKSDMAPPTLVITEGIPPVKLNVEGIIDQTVYTTEKIENVVVTADSMGPVTIEVTSNGKSIAPKDKDLYDIPLQEGINDISIVATDIEGSIEEIHYQVTRLGEQSVGTYYVDSIAGDDSNDGLSPQKPWKSLDKLNSILFKPGTTILFKRGSVWTGQFRPKGSGAEGNPIVVDAYGEGAKPIINGNGISTQDTGNYLSEGAVHLYNISYWEINNLEVTNRGPIGPGTNRSGIMYYAGGAGDVKHIYIRNCYVHDVESAKFNQTPGAQKISGGIIFAADTWNEKGEETNINTYLDDMIAENNHVKNVSSEGIRNKTAWHGLVNTPGGDRRNSNFIFRNNLIEDIYGDGLVMGEIKGGTIGLVEKNIIRRHATCNTNVNFAACWVWNGDGIIFQYNEIYDGINGFNDGEAFDFDISATNCVYQYNYTHHNKGGIMLVMGSAGKNNIYRYNVSKNDGNGSELFYCGAKDTFIYNNTIYIGEGITLPYLIEDGNATQMTFKNNIFYVDGGKVQKFSARSGGSTFDGKKFINNCFYPASILELPGGPTEGTTIGTITENPMLKNPRGEDIVMDTWTESIWHANLEKFTLKEGSPCIDAGVVITNDGGRDNGGKDIYENKLYIGRPNIGAFELNAPLGAISTNDVFIASEDAYVRDVPHADKILVVQ